MSTGQYTPGPFKAVQIIIENSPCVWAIQRKNMRDQWGKPSIATYIDNEADARLLAAAPEMLEALKDALTIIEQDMPRAERNKKRNTILAAIAKAEGKV